MHSLFIETTMYHDIKSIEPEYTTSDLEDTVITITRQDDSEFLLFVSNIENGDKRFVKLLTQQWNNARENTD